jgi:hypothetical protein
VRASDADRERVVDALKAAFVQGLLTKDDLGIRAGQALAARTYGDLAAIMAGIPAAPASAGLARAARPGRPGRAGRAGQAAASARRRVVAWSAGVIVPPALVAAFLTYYGGFIVLFLLTFVGTVVLGGPVQTSARRR